MTNKLFLICLLTGFICAYCEYYWMRNGYRSLALVASKCPRPSLIPIQSQIYIQNNQTRIESILNWFWNIFSTTKDKQVVPIVCETFEIHIDPRSTFILIKTLCLIGLTFKLLSSLKTVPNLIRAKNFKIKQSSSLPKGDGIPQQTKLFETSNGKIGLHTTATTSIDKRNLSLR